MDKIAVLDFGGQYAHLIANRIRRLGVYTEIYDGETSASELGDFKGIILSGGPASVHAEDGLKCDPEILELGIPILGICYGHQLVAHTLGGKVEKGQVREYGSAVVEIKDKRGVLEGIETQEKTWMSHFDQVTEAPEGFEVVASTSDCPVAATANYEKNIYTLQFHPEVTHTPCGMTILENFVNLSGAKREWSIDTYIDDITKEIQDKVEDKKVFLLISGGVDSTVAFLLLAKALGQDRVYGLFVDIGFMRKNEKKEVSEALKKVGVTNLHVYDAGDEYFAALEGKYEPEEKRNIIGELFIDIQAKVSDDLNLNPDEWIIAQGTIYPDTIETGGTKHADTIKTHHNRVDKMQKLIDEGRVIEPISQLYKDEVRLVGERIGLVDEMVWRHPFPGPGLAVRTLCTEGEDKVEGVEDLEIRMNESISDSGFKVKVLPIKSVGVQGDERTYAHPAVVYGGEIDWKLLNKLSTQLTNQFPEVNRVVLGLRPDNFNSWVVKKSYLSRDRISVIQDADKIVMNYISEAGLHREIWQFPTVLIPVDVNGEGGESIVLRPVCSEEAMTANFYPMELDKLSELTKRLSTVNGVCGIFYDITNKPPGTIEWE
ncbi:glutamine-hydrolyzing GMP synthase [Candidatus Peregrinibacteria bacterium]|nr:glutamine-hydrolyzing GMP synthase [Candidatus Peregrinibacteria bacterium]